MKLAPTNSINEAKINHSSDHANETPSPEHNETETNGFPIAPKFLVVWLDTNINDNDSDCQNTLCELRKIIDPIHTFVQNDQCVNFLSSNTKGKIYLIVSGSLGQNFVRLVHHIHQLLAIYVFCADRSKHEEWVRSWAKIKGVFMDILPICEHIQQQIRLQYDRDENLFSIVPTNDETLTTELNKFFMYTQILKEIILDIQYDKKKSIKEFTSHCRIIFSHNEKELDMIDKFEQKYSKSSPIWWYTSECFLHRMLNQALRMMEVNVILKMGFYIRDLHRQIEELHRQQYINPYEAQMFTVYRGQGLSKSNLNKIKQSSGGLISFNYFLSTSKKEIIAQLYARRTMHDTQLIGVVFKMIINPWMSSTPFALVNDVSYYKGSEQEILFSMHTVFRIGNVRSIKVESDQLWEVELELTRDTDQQLQQLTQVLREETQGYKGWFRIGHLLIKLGQFNKAKELYDLLLNQKSTKTERAYIYHQLGWIKANLGQYVDAISSFEQSLSISEKITPICHPDLATCYDNIGLVYGYMGEYMISLSFHGKALYTYRATLRSDHPDLATSLVNVGSVYLKLNNYQRALSSYDEALRIYQQEFPSNHPLLAILYNNIGLVHEKTNDFSKALWFYDKTLHIYHVTMLATHPDLAILHQNIGKALEKMCEYSKSLSHHEKALAIFQKNYSSDHPHIAASYSHMASVYNNMNDHARALSFYEKAIDIRQRILPPHHFDLITSIQNIGEVFEQMKQYSQALSCYERARSICSTTHTPNYPLLASIYYRTAKIYFDMNSYNEAFIDISQCITIGERVLPLDSPELQVYLKTLQSIEAVM